MIDILWLQCSDFKNLCNSTVIQSVNENVIRFPNQNTLSTRVKQIRNPQKEISGGFFVLIEFLKKNTF